MGHKTGETNLIGAIVARDEEEPRAVSLEKVWAPYGMEADGFWVLDTTGKGIGGWLHFGHDWRLCAVRPVHARWRQNRSRAGGKSVLPDDWIAAATTTRWALASRIAAMATSGGLSPMAVTRRAGCSGRGIFIDPRRIVIALQADYPHQQEQAVGGARSRSIARCSARSMPKGVSGIAHRPLISSVPDSPPGCLAPGAFCGYGGKGKR